MSDSLSKSVSFEFLEREIIENVESDHGRRHHWLWLTKVPKRMAKFSEWLEARRGRSWPSNLWAGTSITTQATTIRVRDLLQVGNDETLRFLSVEPQWEAIDLSQWLPHLDWVIQGGESGSAAKPFHLEWARDLLKLCRKHKVPYFLKQLGLKVFEEGEQVALEASHGGDWTEWPKDLRVREFPIGPEKASRSRHVPRRKRASQRA
jgi:protein gp37